MNTNCGNPNGELPNGCAPVQRLTTTVALHEQQLHSCEETIKSIHGFAWKFGSILTTILAITQVLVAFLMKA